MKQNFGLAYQTSFQSNSLLELQNFCIDCMTKSPQKIFKSLGFVSLSEKSLISRWIDKIDTKSIFAYLRGLYLPYTFKLLLRGSRDGFTPKKFHSLCDNI